MHEPTKGRRVSTVKTGFLIVATLVLAGCKSIEGTWQPGCVAFAGDRITLADGRYSWDRFTDAREIDDQGNVVDPYPDFPKTGRYRVDGETVQLLGPDDDVLATFHLHEDGGNYRLLTPEEHAAVLNGGQMPDCPLGPEQNVEPD
jgi:hypothetical protein